MVVTSNCDIVRCVLSGRAFVGLCPGILSVAPPLVGFRTPPYGQGLEQQALAALQNSSLADGQTTVILETSKDAAADWIKDYGFTACKIKNYKTNKHLFLKRIQEDS